VEVGKRKSNWVLNTQFAISSVPLKESSQIRSFISKEPLLLQMLVSLTHFPHASWTLLNLIKVSIKNKVLFSLAGQVPVCASCPGYGADILRQLLLPWTFELLSPKSLSLSVPFPIKQLHRLWTQNRSNSGNRHHCTRDKTQAHLPHGELPSQTVVGFILFCRSKFCFAWWLWVMSSLSCDTPISQSYFSH
jgi:hypothetical protein